MTRISYAVTMNMVICLQTTSPINGHKNKNPMKLTVEAYRTNIVASV